MRPRNILSHPSVFLINVTYDTFLFRSLSLLVKGDHWSTFNTCYHTPESNLRSRKTSNPPTVRRNEPETEYYTKRCPCPSLSLYREANTKGDVAHRRGWASRSVIGSVSGCGFYFYFYPVRLEHHLQGKRSLSYAPQSDCPLIMEPRDRDHMYSGYARV